MLYIKFQGHRSLGSKELFKFLPYMSMVMLPGTFEQIFTPHIPWKLHMKKPHALSRPFCLTILMENQNIATG